MQALLNQVGAWTTSYDANNNPTAFVCTPQTSYGGKLLTAYRCLGGVPEEDMLLRTRNLPVFLTRGTSADIQNQSDNSTTQSSTGYSDIYSNGRRARGSMRFDRDIGLAVTAVKSWQLEAVKRKREILEFKIKRALDYSDQIQVEISQIATLLGDGPGSVAALIANVESMMFSSGRMSVIDNEEDTNGLTIGREGDLSADDGLQIADTDNQRVPTT